MELDSQRVRALAPENSPLKTGMGWKVEDLDKPQIMAESTFSDSHPGNAHLGQLVNEAIRETMGVSGKGARYFTTGICSGVTQGHDGINCLLVHRDMVANVIEIHGNPIGFDEGVSIANCSKSMPVCLTGLARLDMPSITMTGGVVDVGPDLLTLEQISAYSAVCQRGEITEEEPTYYKYNACPSCGACSSVGTASTTQVAAEALGLMLPGSALMSATCGGLKETAHKAGLQVMEPVRKGLKVNDTMTMKSFENVIMVHVAVSDSANPLLHIPATAYELGLEIDADIFDRMRRGAHHLLNIRLAEEWPTQFFYYAGDVPVVMERIKPMLHLDAMAVTGKTLGENLEELEAGGSCDKCNGYLKKWRLKRIDIIRTFEEPIGTDGTVTILREDPMPEGSAVEHSTVPEEIFKAALRAKPFDCEEDAIGAVILRKIQPGDTVLTRYKGPKGSGMPEVLYTTEVIFSDPELGRTVALITDGRSSGASKGPAIRHASPEAADDGLIALAEEGDPIRIDVLERVLEIIGVKGEEFPREEVERTLAKRGKARRPEEAKYREGVLKTHSEHVISPMKGGYMV